MRIFLEGQQDLRLAIEKPSGTRLLMMRIHRHSLATGMTFPDSNGFEVKRAVLPGDGEKYLTLQLILTNRRFQDIFTALVEDISANIASIPVESDAVQFMNSRLRRWQLFLERNGSDGLGEESQHGLYGELWVLRQHVLPQLGALGVEYWTGPTGAVQDFQFPGYAIEVKTTVTKQPQKISNKVRTST